MSQDWPRKPTTALLSVASPHQHCRESLWARSQRHTSCNGTSRSSRTSNLGDPSSGAGEDRDRGLGFPADTPKGRDLPLKGSWLSRRSLVYSKSERVKGKSEGGDK